MKLGWLVDGISRIDHLFRLETLRGWEKIHHFPGMEKPAVDPPVVWVVWQETSFLTPIYNAAVKEIGVSLLLSKFGEILGST